MGFIGNLMFRLFYVLIKSSNRYIYYFPFLLNFKDMVLFKGFILVILVSSLIKVMGGNLMIHDNLWVGIIECVNSNIFTSGKCELYKRLFA